MKTIDSASHEYVPKVDVDTDCSSICIASASLMLSSSALGIKNSVLELLSKLSGYTLPKLSELYDFSPSELSELMLCFMPLLTLRS